MSKQSKLNHNYKNYDNDIFLERTININRRWLKSDKNIENIIFKRKTNKSLNIPKFQKETNILLPFSKLIPSQLEIKSPINPYFDETD